MAASWALANNPTLPDLVETWDLDDPMFQPAKDTVARITQVTQDVISKRDAGWNITSTE